MWKHLHFCVAGGDLRQLWLAQLLARTGARVSLFALGRAPGLEAAEQCLLSGLAEADCVVLPLPLAEAGERLNAPLSERPYLLSEVFGALLPTQTLCAGLVAPEASALAAKRGLVLRDYFSREELAVKNAVPTAEGALRIAMGMLPGTLHGARALVVGYGRIGKILAQRLCALGAQVTVSVRKAADLAWAEAFGLQTCRTGALSGALGGFELIFNTVPAPVLDETALRALPPGAAVIDLASAPGGVDLAAARRLGVNALCAPGLPGKEAPAAAAAYIRDAVFNILEELGV